MAGQIGLAGGAAYGATKAALASMTRAWAAEFSPSGVRVNAIDPGPVYTGGAAPERIEALGATTLQHRAADPAEIAEVVAFLASPRDRKSTRLNSSHGYISYAVFCLKKKNERRAGAVSLLPTPHTSVC